jgi:hypothetical protein
MTSAEGAIQGMIAVERDESRLQRLFLIYGFPGALPQARIQARVLDAKHVRG